MAAKNTRNAARTATFFALAGATENCHPVQREKDGSPTLFLSVSFGNRGYCPLRDDVATMSNGHGRANAEADRNAEALLLASQKQRDAAVQERGLKP